MHNALSRRPIPALLVLLAGFAGQQAQAQSLKEIASDRHKYAPVKCVAFSPEGALLATAGPNISVREASTGKEKLVLKFKGAANKLAFTPDGKRLIAAVHRFTPRMAEINVWDAKSGELQRTIDWPDALPISGLAVSSDSNSVFVADGLMLKQWDLASGKEIRTIRPKPGGISYVACSPKQELFVTVGGFGRWGTVWDARSGEQVAALPVKGEGAGEPVFSPHGALLGTVVSTIGRNTRMAFWNTRTWKQNPDTPELIEVRKFAFAPDGKTIAALAHDTTARLYELASGKEIASLAMFEAPGDTDAIAFAPHGKTLAVGGHEIRDTHYHGFFRLLEVKMR